MKNFEEFKKILIEIENLPGQKINSATRLLEISFKMMVINFGRLKNHLDEVPLFDVRQREEIEKFQIESLRLFTNFLNSAAAFKDHVRNYIKKIYKDTSTALGGEYQKKVDAEFANDPLTGFIESLRNIADHQNVLPIGLLTTVPQGEVVTKVILDKKSLEEDYGIDKKTKLFLDSVSDKTIDVIKISESYINKTIFPWLMHQQSIIHKKEFLDLQELRKRAKALLDE